MICDVHNTVNVETKIQLYELRAGLDLAPGCVGLGGLGWARKAGLLGWAIACAAQKSLIQ